MKLNLGALLLVGAVISADSPNLWIPGLLICGAMLCLVLGIRGENE